MVLAMPWTRCLSITSATDPFGNSDSLAQTYFARLPKTHDQGLTSAFPDLKLFLYSYVRKEAVLSSQIEGTQSSLSDLIFYENAETPGVPLDDVQEVSNCVAALNHGLKRLRGGFPLSLRLMREIHEVLLSKGRGSHAQPGEFRRSQNWIGGTRPGNAAYVPPPPEYVRTAWASSNRSSIWRRIPFLCSCERVSFTVSVRRVPLDER